MSSMWTSVVSAVVLVVVIHNVSGNPAGPRLLSCGSCHANAKCLESPAVDAERGGDTFSSGQSVSSVSCVCNHGFVGDGLACYDVALCSRDHSSCCQRGYTWSPEKGCVDVDECSLPGAPPCAHGSPLCVNTPGSFHCLTPPSAVQFPCGDALCPLGEDCITGVNGTSRCADPCDDYMVLDDPWRSTHFNQYQNGSNEHCDQNVKWHGWYRLFLGQSNAEIPTVCVVSSTCGTSTPMWLNQSNPTVSDGIVQRPVCGSWFYVGGPVSECCGFPSPPIHVKNCLNYYVYKLVSPITAGHCAAYCEVRGQPPSPAPVTQPPPSSASRLICGQTRIQMGLGLSSLGGSSGSSGFSAFSGHLDDPACSSSTQYDGWVWYQVERQADTCGNLLTTNGTHAIYSNSLFFYLNNASTPVTFPFSCAYPLDTETSLHGAIRPYIQTEGRGVEGVLSGVGSQASASMLLFRDSNYTEPYPAGPVRLAVGSVLYVGVSVQDPEPSLVVVLDQCYATHTSNPDGPERHFFIQDKCSSDRRQVTVVESGSSFQARFSALFFLFQGDNRDVYLHCSLHLCDNRASSCSPVCSGRRVRSVSTPVPVQPLTIGPITWENPAV